MIIGHCVFCTKLIENDEPAPERKPVKSIEELAEYFQPAPHVICAECVRKYMNEFWKKDTNWNSGKE